MRRRLYGGPTLATATTPGRPRRTGAPLVGAVLVGLTATGAMAQEPTSLSELAAIAKQRFEEERPRQLEALRGFLADLELSYDTRQNRDYLDKRFEAAAALGDGIVPLLLEKLSPAQEGDEAQRNVAANSARVLEHLGPGGFVDPLLQLANGENYTARLHAIHLLGASRSPMAASGLTKLLTELAGPHRVQAVKALTRLAASAATAQVAAYLNTPDLDLRTAALQFIAETSAPAARRAMLDALAAESDRRLLPYYLRYFAQTARDDAEAAEALVGLLSDAMLEPTVKETIHKVLGKIAPQDHGPSLAACERVLEAGATGSLALTCALTMRDLGSGKGVNKLLANLETALRRDRKRADLYIDRGKLLVALERWGDATQNFQEAIKHSRSSSVRSFLHLSIASCEAHRGRWQLVLRALRESRATHARILQEASRDPALRAALQQTSIRSYLDKLDRDSAPTGR
ncbi:MAG: hypothetical protein AAF628_00445 [Planctomycetota bacterium]